MSRLNLGILAHVDAGKTTLTERLLYDAGVIRAIGRVDDGTTQTDFLPLERQRGITIKSAVVSFAIGDVTVNLIDTPGHPDFIAEVERVLNVLDGAVLVISAVEGVQAQTRVLMRTLRRLKIPTLLFVNKIDRAGARYEPLLHSVAERLIGSIVPMSAVEEQGTPAARVIPLDLDARFTDCLTEVLADHDDFLAAYAESESSLAADDLRRWLARLTGKGILYPVYFGSAVTGAGLAALRAGIAEFLPAAGGSPDAAVSGTVFKIERGPAGEKVACARLFAGTLRVRDRVCLGQGGERKVTAIQAFDRGPAARAPSVQAGQIAKLWGLDEVRIGDAIGLPPDATPTHHFVPPTLETAVVPRCPAEKAALHLALSRLAEQDPLINLRQDDRRGESFLSLYGEVQKEVIQETLALEYNLDVTFRASTPICIERPTGIGSAVEVMGRGKPFLATVGLRIESAPVGSGIDFRLDVDVISVPLYVYKSIDEFQRAMREYVRVTFQQGLYGWEVSDCIVTMTRSGYASPATTAGDFRLLTPLVLMSALREAGTMVCEPIDRFRLDIPPDALGGALSALSQLGAAVYASAASDSIYLLEGEIPVDRVHHLRQQLPGVTRGEGVLECSFGRYRPVSGSAPTRPRFDLNPLNREEYLLHLSKRV